MYLKTLDQKRFWEKVNKLSVVISSPHVDTPCWLWTAGTRGKTGYGSMKIRGEVIDSHRIAYELQCGPIPPGFLVCHSCDNRLCTRGSHLFIGTHKDNAQDKTSKGRCPKELVSLRKEGPDGMAWCSSCQSFHLTDQFGKDKSHWNGLACYCKKSRARLKSVII